MVYNRFNFEHYAAYNYNLDEEYKKIILKFGKDLEAASNAAEIEKIFNDFVQEYTIIPGICQTIINYFMEENYDGLSNILKTLLLQFYDWGNFEAIRNSTKWKSLQKTVLPFTKCFNYDVDLFHTDASLTYPSSGLDQRLLDYDERKDIPFSEEILKKNEKAKIVAKQLSKHLANHDFEGFINTCFEWEDKKFTYQSIEYRLADSYRKKDFWKAYVKAVRNQNKKIMLNVYKRYTGLFLEDKEMKKEYENEKIQAMADPEFENLPDLEYYLFDEYSNSLENVKDVFENGKTQTFCLPKTIISYILNASTSKNRFKLFQSCKLFFIQKPTPICQKMNIGMSNDMSEYFQHSLQIINNHIDFNVLQNLYINNRLNFRYPDLQMLSNVILKMHRCEARFIHIWQQLISLSDLEFLASTKLEKFTFDNGGITNSDGTAASVPDILKLLGNSHHINILMNETYELTPSFYLSDLKRKTKLIYFRFGSFSSLLNLEDYCDFILKNAGSSKRAYFSLSFGENVSIEDAGAFDKAVNEFTLEKFNKKFHDESMTGYYRNYKSKNLSKFPIQRRHANH